MEVVHDAKHRKFVIHNDGKDAYLRYAEDGSGRMEFVSTYVPDEMRGQGVASEIIKAAAEYAVSTGLRIVPVCSYAQSYFKKHEEYRENLAES